MDTDRLGIAHGIAPAGFRLPDATCLGPVTLQVADLARSIDWYRRVLGIQVIEEANGRAVLATEGEEAPLVTLLERPGARPVPRRGRLGLYHYAILLPDRAALGRFAAHLGEIQEPAGASDHLVSEALYLQDPDGLGIEVYTDRPRDSWKQRDRQLVMATEPLNLADVVRAAGGERWSGMPAGTVMGHVHLHVGDLEAADAFYHRGLGLDRMVWSYPGALFLSAGGYHHHLGVNTWAAGAAPAGEEDARLVEWQLVLPTPDEIARALESIRLAGFEVDRVASRVIDPWGTPLRLIHEERQVDSGTGR